MMYDVKSSTKPAQDKDIQFRLLLFIIITIISLLILIFIIGNIQILKNLSYEMRSKKNREKVVRLLPIRGKILSSDNEILADNITAFNIYINKTELYKNNDLLQNELLYISSVLNIKYSDLVNILQSSTITNEEILLAENISLITFSKIKENLDKLPGITYKEVLYRYYPNNDVLSHVLGHIGPINTNELMMKEKEGYNQTDFIGKNGVEQYYEDILRGKPGEKVYLIDAKMSTIRELENKEIKPEPGNELILTINFNLQKTVEDILADRAGTIVVLRPSTGEVLAMASYPDYDPNIYILKTKENNTKKKEILLDTKDTPLLNRNIQSVYPAASIFKLVTTTAILKENIIPIDKKFYCSGNYRIGRQYYKCWVYPANHGWQNLMEGIMNSCDIYFYNASLLVGPNRINQYALSYGFNNILGIDLPFEKSGTIPSPEWMKNKGEIWQDGHTLNTVIGQGDVKVTPIQIANFMSVICNKGYSYRPHLLKEIRDSKTGFTINTYSNQKIIDVKDYGEYVFTFIHNALRAVVKSGTASRVFYANPLKVAGKTGTAEIGAGDKKQTHSWFAGFGPIDMPIEEQIVVVALIEYENNEFLKYAAPIASMVFYSWFFKTDFHDTAKRLGYPIRDTYNKVKRQENEIH